MESAGQRENPLESQVAFNASTVVAINKIIYDSRAVHKLFSIFTIGVGPLDRVFKEK